MPDYTAIGERYILDQLSTNEFSAHDELRSLGSTEVSLSFRIKGLQEVPDDGIEAFEMSNVIRLGLIRTVHEPEAHVGAIAYPLRSLQGEPVGRRGAPGIFKNGTYVLAELGEPIFEACSEKNAPTPVPSAGFSHRTRRIIEWFLIISTRRITEPLVQSPVAAMHSLSTHYVGRGDD